MKRCLTSVTIFLILLTCLQHRSLADGLIDLVPDRKASVEYLVTEKWADGTTREFYIELKMVRSAIYQKATGSFVECLFYVDRESPPKLSYLFFLPADKEFNHDYLEKSPLVWSKTDGRYKRKDDAWDGFLPRLKLLFPPTASREKLSRTTTEIKDRTFECIVTKGNVHYTTNMEKTELDYSISRSADVPFGVVHMTLVARNRQHGEPAYTKGELEFTLLGFE